MVADIPSHAQGEVLLPQLNEQEITDHATLRGAEGPGEGVSRPQLSRIAGGLPLQERQTVRSADVQQGFPGEQ